MGAPLRTTPDRQRASRMMPFGHTVRRMNQVVVVSFLGSVSLETSRHVRLALLDCVDREQTLLIELSGVTYMDTAGVATLIAIFRRAARRGRRISLVALSAASRRTLEVFRLERAFPTYETLAEALSAPPQPIH